MQSLRVKAKRLLLEIEAIQAGNFDNRTKDLLILINQALKDAVALAEDIVGPDWQDDTAPDDAA